MGSDFPRWAALLISAMLMAPFLVALTIYLRHLRRTRTWTRATATVTGTTRETARQGDGSTTTTVTVTYAYVDATETDRTGTAINPVGEPGRGDSLQVMYDPSDPDRSKVVDLGRRFLIASTAFFLLFALGVWSLFAPFGQS
jgi:hypothetical protein